MGEVVHVVQMPWEVLAALVGIFLTNLIAFVVLIARASRWSATIEGELKLLNQRVDQFIKVEADDIKARIGRLEGSVYQAPRREKS